jgi:hypothetical protein
MGNSGMTTEIPFSEQFETLGNKKDKLLDLCARFEESGWKLTGLFKNHCISEKSLGPKLTTEEVKPLLFKRRAPLTSREAFDIIYDDQYWTLLVVYIFIILLNLQTIVNRNLCASLQRATIKATNIYEMKRFYGMIFYNKFNFLKEW